MSEKQKAAMLKRAEELCEAMFELAFIMGESDDEAINESGLSLQGMIDEAKDEFQRALE